MASPASRPKLTQRERDEFEQFYRQEAVALYRYACSNGLIRVDERQDLVQTTFRDAIHDWAKVGVLGPGERRRWLRRVLSNKAIDLYRKQRVVDLSADPSHPPSRFDDTSERAELAIALEECRRVIQRMPPVRRKVADLVWGESWATERVAEHLALAPSTVRGHLRAARRQLRASVGHLVPFIDDEGEQEAAS